jgi:tetratricopeptide (TPR) repeat protein
MSRTVDVANREISRVRDLPYGLARTQAAERQVRLVEAEGPVQARAYALSTLVEAYVWGGEVERAYVPFTQLVRWWDEHPEHFDEQDRHTLFWSFKWMVANLTEFPTVPAEQIERTLDDMEQRFALAGNGMNAVALQRFVWARARGTDDTAAAYERWVATPRDDFSQCEACEPGDRASYLFEVGRTDEGIRLLERTLLENPSCATEPADMLSHLQLAYLEQGRFADAAATHRRAVGHLAESHGDMAGARGRAVELLARGGHPDRAVRMIESDERLLVRGDSPDSRLTYLIHVGAAVHVLAAARPDHRVRLTGVPAATLGELETWVRAEAEQLAAAFDRRNGTSAQADLVARAWLTEPAPERLDLAVIRVDAAASAPDGAIEPDGATAPSGGAAARTGGSDVVAAGSPPDVLREADRLAASGDLASAAPLYLAEAARFQEAGLLADAGAAFAEAARGAQVLDDHDGAHWAYTRATALLRAGGADPLLTAAVVRAHAPSAAELGDALGALADVERGRADLDDDDGDASPGESRPGPDAGATDRDPAAELAERRRLRVRRERADLDDCAARLLATLGRTPEAASRASLAAEAFAAAGHLADASHAFWLAGRLHADLAALDDAVWNLESAVEGFGLARDHTRRAEASATLIEVLRRAGRDADADEVARALTD